MIEFKKNETIIQNLTFMALMAAINVVFVILSTLVPFLTVVLVFVLPLTSVTVTLYCKKRFFPIYAVATTVLCLVVVFWNFSDTLFYVIPSIISGFLFGILAEKKCPSIFLVLVPTLVQVVFTYISIPLIKLIFELDIITFFLNVFGLQNNPNIYLIIPSFILLLSLIQSTLSYMVLKEELPKLQIVLIDNNRFKYLTLIGTTISLLLMGILAPFIVEWSYFALMVSIFFGIYIAIDSFNDKKLWVLILEGISLLLTFFIFSSCYNLIDKTHAFLLIAIFPLSMTIIAFCNICLSKLKKKDTIKPAGKQ